MAAGDITQGRRLPDCVFGEPGPGWDGWRESQPADYMKVTIDGRVEWWIRDPWGSIGALRTHRVDEHDDGTITASPSIWDRDGGPPSQEEIRRMGIVSIIPQDGTGWHGYLERGVWRQV